MHRDKINKLEKPLIILNQSIMRILFLLFLFCVGILPLNAQTEGFWREVPFERIFDVFPILTGEDAFDAMDLDYTSVDGLSLYSHCLHWEPYSSIGLYPIKSTDKHFVSGLGIPFMQRVFGRSSRETIGDRNIYYFNQIRDLLIDVSGKYDESYRDKFSMKDLKENVYYYPEVYAKEVFNADTVISFSLPVKKIKNEVFEKNKNRNYVKCEVLVLHKNDLGPLFLYCFFTDKGYKNRDEYMAKFAKAVKFKDHDRVSEELLFDKLTKRISLNYTVPKDYVASANTDYVRLSELDAKTNLSGNTFKLTQTIGRLFHSKWEHVDKECVVLMSLGGAGRFYDYQKSAPINLWFYSGAKTQLEIGDIGKTITKKHVLEIKKKATFLTKEEQKKYFNADVALTFPIDIKEAVYQHKYILRQAMHIGKGNMHLRIYFLLTDKGVENIDKYLDDVKSAFRFD